MIKKNLRRYYTVYFKEAEENPFFQAQFWGSLPLAKKTLFLCKQKKLYNPVIVEITKPFFLQNLPNVRDPESQPGLRVIKEPSRKK